MFGTYHRTLVADVQRPGSVVERIVAMNVRTIPWVVPLVLAVAICWCFSLEGVRSLGVSLATSATFTVMGWRIDRDRARKAGTWL